MQKFIKPKVMETARFLSRSNGSTNAFVNEAVKVAFADDMQKECEETE